MKIEPEELPELPCEAWYASERWLEEAARQLKRLLFWTDDAGLREEVKAAPRQRAMRVVYDALKPTEEAMASLRALLVHTRKAMAEFELCTAVRSENERTTDPLCSAVVAAEHALLESSRIVHLCAEDLVNDVASWGNHYGKPASNFLREGVEYSLDDFIGSVDDSRKLGRELNNALTAWFNRNRAIARLN